MSYLNHITKAPYFPEILHSPERDAGERDSGEPAALLWPGAGCHRPRHHRGGPRRQGLQEPGAALARPGDHAHRGQPRHPQVRHYTTSLCEHDIYPKTKMVHILNLDKILPLL